VGKLCTAPWSAQNLQVTCTGRVAGWLAGWLEEWASRRRREEALGGCGGGDGEEGRASRIRDTVDGEGGGEGLSPPRPTLLIVKEVRWPSAVITTFGLSCSLGGGGVVKTTLGRSFNFGGDGNGTVTALALPSICLNVSDSSFVCFVARRVGAPFCSLMKASTHILSMLCFPV